MSLDEKLERVLSRHQELGHLMNAANALPSDLAQAREAGFDGYLTKPLDLADLLAAVDRWLAPRA